MCRRLRWIIAFGLVVVVGVAGLAMFHRRDNRFDFIARLGPKLALNRREDFAYPLQVLTVGNIRKDKYLVSGRRPIDLVRTFKQKLLPLGFHEAYEGGYPQLGGSGLVLDMNSPKLSAEFDWADKGGNVEIQMLTGSYVDSSDPKHPPAPGDILVVVAYRKGWLDDKIDAVLSSLGLKT